MRTLLKRFTGRITLTLGLVVLEAVGWTLFPLAIGRAINSAIAGTTGGLYEFAGLGVIVMMISVGRRMVDSRAYGRIFTILGRELVHREPKRSTSATTARIGMLREIVQFFEDDLPQLISSLIGLVGTIGILWALTLPVALGCFAVAVVMVVLYALTGRLTTRYNKGLNDELEQQVDAIRDTSRVGRHLRDFMRWKIKLSDLEAGNFGVVWLFMMALLVFTIQSATRKGLDYGSVFSVVMYVFQFAESVILLPMYYQQWLRLRDISRRIATLDSA